MDSKLLRVGFTMKWHGALTGQPLDDAIVVTAMIDFCVKALKRRFDVTMEIVLHEDTPAWGTLAGEDRTGPCFGVPEAFE